MICVLKEIKTKNYKLLKKIDKLFQNLNGFTVSKQNPVNKVHIIVFFNIMAGSSRFSESPLFQKLFKNCKKIENRRNFTNEM